MYEFYNLPYFTTTGQINFYPKTPAEIFQNITSANPHGETTVLLFTDASKSDKHCSIAFHSPQLKHRP